MEPNYPQLTIEEMQIIISASLRQFYEEQRTWKIDHSKYIELCHKIYYETQSTGALFFNIVQDYEISKEGE